MCFSAEASFIASGGLTVLGGATYAVAKKKDRILVAIPILFGIQQFFEGVQWLYLGRGSSSLWAGYGFLFFALIVWPVYVPTFVFLLDRQRRKLLRWFIALGVAMALFFLVLLATQDLRVFVQDNCVHYAFDNPNKWIALPYLFAVLGALFASSREVFRWFGLGIFALAVIAGVVYHKEFISVWCFFSAIVSAMFFVYVQRKRSRRVPAPE
jgi:hypothetical protein